MSSGEPSAGTPAKDSPCILTRGSPTDKELPELGASTTGNGSITASRVPDLAVRAGHGIAGGKGALLLIQSLSERCSYTPGSGSLERSTPQSWQAALRGLDNCSSGPWGGSRNSRGEGSNAHNGVGEGSTQLSIPCYGLYNKRFPFESLKVKQRRTERRPPPRNGNPRWEVTGHSGCTCLKPVAEAASPLPTLLSGGSVLPAGWKLFSQLRTCQGLSLNTQCGQDRSCRHGLGLGWSPQFHPLARVFVSGTAI